MRRTSPEANSFGSKSKGSLGDSDAGDSGCRSEVVPAQAGGSVSFCPLAGSGDLRSLSLGGPMRRGSGGTTDAPSFDLSFKSAKSVADSIEEGDSFTRSKSTNAFNVEANTRSRLLRSQNTVKNLLSYQTAQARLHQSEKTRREERIDFVEHVRRVRLQLSQMSRWTLNPHSRFVRYWDFVILTALMITVFITPWEVSFLPPTRVASDDWGERPITFVVNRLVDTVFVIDVGLAFFLPYRTKRTGMWVYEKRRIVRNYLRGWFTLVSRADLKPRVASRA